MSYQTIVVGYDGSSGADRAVEAVGELLAPGGTVHVVTASHPQSNAEIAQSIRQLPAEFQYMYDPSAVEQQRQNPALTRLRGAGLECQGHIVLDDPASAIIGIAERERADLVVVGSRGLGGAARFFRGSVSARVATQTPMSVLIVHEL